MRKKILSKFQSCIPSRKRIFSKKGFSVLILVFILLSVNFFFTTNQAHAALITSAGVQMGDPRASQTSVPYTVNFTFPGTASIKCIQVTFYTNATPGGGEPAGMATTGSSGSLHTGTSGGLTPGSWTYYAGTDGTFQLEDSSGEASTATAAQIDVTGVTNPSGSSFYAQITTYSAVASHVCSSQVDVSNVMALVTQAGITVTATVNPSLSVSVANDSSAVNGSGSPSITTTSTTIPFGTLTPGTGVVGAHTVQVSTNAAHGYFLYLRYTGKPTDSNNDQISDTSGTNGSPSSFSGSSSTSAFGYITDNANESQFTSNTWAKFTTTNAEVGRSASAVNADTTHLGYQIEAANTTPPGTYSTTVTLTATGSY